MLTKTAIDRYKKSVMANNCDTQYLQLVRNILGSGERVETGAKIDGENISALELFGPSMTFDLREGFPIITTRRISFNIVAHELCWFMGKDTNIKYLTGNGINIWSSWTDPLGDVGPLYPHQLRRIMGFYGGEIDQVKDVIENIIKVKNNPDDRARRRLVISTWNVRDLSSLLPYQLYPCHGLVSQFNVSGNYLDLITHQRSADVMLGLPTNISSYALFLSLIAHLTNLLPRKLIYNIGSAHIYTNHKDQLTQQLDRTQHPLPTLKFVGDFDIDSLKRENMILEGYKHSGVIKGRVAI